jgi:putative tryptophan/tyrosine transport system substrate-binding protein
MRRRKLISLIFGAAALWPLGAAAQQTNKARRIGVLFAFAENDEVWQAYLAAFRRRLQDLGWTEGQNLQIDYRFVGENTERTGSAAEELVALAPDVIFVTANPAVSALMRLTRTIPIVFTWVSDSVGTGYVTSLAHPGGNITGFHNYEPAFGGKWLQLLKEVAPGVRRIAVVHVPEIAANSAFLHVIEAAATSFGVTVTAAGVRNAADIERVLLDFGRDPDGGLIITPSPLTATRRDVIVAIAEKARLPAIYPFRFYAASGGLLSYGFNQMETVRGAASYVDRILRGANPGDLPVELPTKFQLVINLKTARALGLQITDAFLSRADDVIE